MSDRLDGPNILKPVPSGIVKIRKTPLIMALACLICVVVYLIFNVAGKQEQRRQKKESRLDQAQLGSISKVSDDEWFLDKKYDDIRQTHVPDDSTKETENTNEDKSDNVSFEDNPVVLQPKNSFEQDYEEEERKTQLELLRLEQQMQIEERKFYLRAVKSPAEVLVGRNGENEFENNTTAMSSDNKVSQLKESSPSRYPEGLAGYQDQNMQGSKKDFIQSAGYAGEYLMHTKKKPISEFEIKAGTVIPAALMTGINSDLPGNIIAQVRENIYDTVTGEHVLIPQGARLIGQYNSQVSLGQNRALVIWTRLIFPDGSSLNLDKMQGVDSAGYAGFEDKVNHHYWRIYGNAFLLSLVGAGYELLNDDSDSDEARDKVASGIGQQLTQVTTEMMRKNINIQPTIEIRPGYKFNVLVLKDIILTP